MPTLKEIRENYISLPDIDIQTVLSGITGRERPYILAHPEYRPGIIRYIKIRTALNKLSRGYPVAYVLGHKEFFGLDFLVNRHTLIPRPDTEIMVEEAANILGRHAGGALLIDVGTGSGCVPIAINKTLNNGGINTSLRTIALDISLSALRVAKKNAKRHGVNITFKKSGLLKNLCDPQLNNADSIVITANLPYLTRAWAESEPSIAYEPRIALIADEINGLSLYEKLFQQISDTSWFREHRLSILGEIDPRQSAAAAALAKKYFPSAGIRIKKDLSGHDRLIVIEGALNLKP